MLPGTGEELKAKAGPREWQSSWPTAGCGGEGCGQYSQRHGDVEEAPVGQAHVKCCCQCCGDRDTQPGQPAGKHEAETPEALLTFPFHQATQG